MAKHRRKYDERMPRIFIFFSSPLQNMPHTNLFIPLIICLFSLPSFLSNVHSQCFKATN
ncbi:unnamed protein product [Meloidogyne enterolobii]|uniref:Uncharacterized protein n=1 Tax=Meloidogyne enterolobii TaxID=390850 RepID=A0ACB1B757_MELEN